MPLPYVATEPGDVQISRLDAAIAEHERSFQQAEKTSERLAMAVAEELRATDDSFSRIEASLHSARRSAAASHIRAARAALAEARNLLEGELPF